MNNNNSFQSERFVKWSPLLGMVDHTCFPSKGGEDWESGSRPIQAKITKIPSQLTARYDVHSCDPSYSDTVGRSMVV
jgi:hypothetical protein